MIRLPLVTKGRMDRWSDMQRRAFENERRAWQKLVEEMAAEIDRLTHGQDHNRSLEGGDVEQESDVP